MYFSWGKELFEKGDFNQAFEVTADGYYRYQDVPELKKNMLAAFFNALQQNYRQKDWPQSEKLLEEMDALEVLDEPARDDVDRLLRGWLPWLVQQGKKEEALKGIGRLLERHPGDAGLLQMREQVSGQPETPQ
jgi:hypothetical protein